VGRTTQGPSVQSSLAARHGSEIYGSAYRGGFPGSGISRRGATGSRVTGPANLDQRNQGKESLGTTILLLVIDGNRGPNGWITRCGLERGGGPGSAPGVVIEVGGVGMVSRHCGSNDEKDRHSTTEHRNVEYWADALVVQSRVDQKDGGNSGPSAHVPRGSSSTGVVPYSQVVSFTDVTCV
jgi:hypothetical protein